MRAGFLNRFLLPAVALIPPLSSGRAEAQAPPVHFKRGDCNGDGRGDVSDPIFVLNRLFLGGVRPGCLEACDSNHDGALDLSDAVFLLAYLFTDGEPVPAPGLAACGVEPGGSSLGCEAYLACGAIPTIFVAEPKFVPTGGTAPFCAVSPPVDLDGNGNLDTAVTLRDSGEVVVLLGDGAGGFEGRRRLALTTAEDHSPEALGAGAAASGSGISAGDLDGDGDFDLVAVDAGQRPRQGRPSADLPGYLLSYRNDGQGFTRMAPVPAGRWTVDLVALDLDGDDHLDLVAFNRGEQGSYQVFLSAGGFDFNSRPEVFFADCPNPHFTDAAGDFDGDGDLDVAVPCAEPQRNLPPPDPVEGKFLVLPGNGDGTFGEPSVIHGFGLRSPHHMVSADFNADGRLDLATANIGAASEEGRINVFFGDGGGGFENRPGSPFPVHAPGTTTPFVSVGDVGGPSDGRPDGFPDLVLTNRSGTAGVLNSFTVLLNDRRGGASTTFIEGSSLRLPVPVGEGLNLQMPALGDFNNDGLPDVAGTFFGTSAVPAGLAVLLHAAYD